MELIVPFRSVFATIILVPIFILLILINCFLSIVKSLGVTNLYINFLLAVFEHAWTTETIVKKRLERNSQTSQEIQYCECETVICREGTKILMPETIPNNSNSNNSRKHSIGDSYGFRLCDLVDYIKTGMEAIIEDQVTSRFEAQQLKSWNLLTRTNRNYEFISWKLTIIWIFGFLIRHFILFPIRLIISLTGVMFLITSMILIGYIKGEGMKAWLNTRICLMCFSILSCGLSAVVAYHNEENKPKNGICVANHTSPIDALILMRDNCYSLIGQIHGGFLGLVQRSLAEASHHIWFERFEVTHRIAVGAKMRRHVMNLKNPPILIFPEGTCINNTSVMQFKKGSFEIDTSIYPVAMKYDPRFGDAFWNSRRDSYLKYLYLVMTSWAIVCDVWYLPPMRRLKAENASNFAKRVKGTIARKGGLVDLVWDGHLKRERPKKAWKKKYQSEFSDRLRITSRRVKLSALENK